MELSKLRKFILTHDHVRVGSYVHPPALVGAPMYTRTYTSGYSNIRFLQRSMAFARMERYGHNLTLALL